MNWERSHDHGMTGHMIKKHFLIQVCRDREKKTRHST